MVAMRASGFRLAPGGDGSVQLVCENSSFNGQGGPAWSRDREFRHEIL